MTRQGTSRRLTCVLRRAGRGPPGRRTHRARNRPPRTPAASIGRRNRYRNPGTERGSEQYFRMFLPALLVPALLRREPPELRHCWRIRRGAGGGVGGGGRRNGRRARCEEESMSLRPQPGGPVPEATARVARAAFPKGNAYLRLRDELGAIYEDAAFAALFAMRGRPAEAPWRLALVSVLQFAEDLSDRAAADAVRSRIDWKYVLGLELTDPGFDASVLSEFRTRLVGGGV